MSIEATHTVDDIMRRWPVTIRVFLIHRMRCIGCPIACFHTVEDACREHGADRRRFLADLRAAVDGTLVRATEVISRGEAERHGEPSQAWGSPSASTNSLCGSRMTMRCRPPSTQP